MSAPAIRRARRADRAEALVLWQALHREHEALDPRYRLAPDAALRWGHDFDEWVRESPHLVLLAEAPEGAVGLLVAHLGWPSPVYAPVLFAHVDDLFVRPDWRGRGVGRRLLEAATAWARREGAQEIRAGVLATNEGAMAFWQRAGAAPFHVGVTLPLGAGA